MLDRETPLFAHPDKVHELDHEGEWFDVRGPLTVPRTPQGRPVLMQAGSSGRGREFAAKWAELIFTGDPGIDVARAHYKDQKEKIGERGRDPDSIKMLPMAYTVVGESKAHAEEREQLFLNDLVDPMASLTLLSELMNYDFSGLALDAPITDELIESVSGIRGLVQNIRTHIGGDTVTLADLAGHRATLLQGPRFVGTGPDIADQMEAWFDSGACDGFVIAATHSPGAYEDVVRLVVPELQRRGVFRDRYTELDAPWASRTRAARVSARCLTRSDRCRACGSSTPPRLAAGPMVATALGEFGAEVIKVEQPGAGDPLRTWGHQKDGIGLFWKSVGRNKQCVTLDLRAAEGQELFHRLLHVSDVLVVNNRPSALARWGLDYESVHRAHPQLVMLHVSGYGGGGPASDRPGFGTLAEAMSGFAHVTGQPDGPPTLPPFFLADGIAAQSATFAVMMALYHRDLHGGTGQLVDVNLVEPLARLIETSTLAYSHLGIVMGRTGNRLDASAPRNAYRTADGRWVALSSASRNIVMRLYRCRRPAGPGGGRGLRRPDPPPGPRRRDRRHRGGLDPRPLRSTTSCACSRRPMWRRPPSTTPNSCSPTSICASGAPSSRWTTPTSGA